MPLSDILNHIFLISIYSLFCTSFSSDFHMFPFTASDVFVNSRFNVIFIVTSHVVRIPRLCCNVNSYILINLFFSVKISIPLENTGVSSVFATSVWPFSLIFSLARRNEGNFFQAVPTTLSSSLAEVRLASLVAWA